MRFQVTVSDETGKEIIEAAKAEGRSVSGWARRVIEGVVVAAKAAKTYAKPKAVVPVKIQAEVQSSRPPSIFDGVVPLKEEANNA